jgi:PHD/YefM family antitoxin component YafN of YafNO toxin-antitoxin module
MASITANLLKTKGVSALDPVIDENKAVVITVRGRDRYVVMDFETYNHLRECELQAAIAEVRTELESGEVFKDTVDQHIRRIRNDL